MDVLEFKLCDDLEWEAHRVATIINGIKASEYAQKAKQMSSYDYFVEKYCGCNGGVGCNQELVKHYNTFKEEYLGFSANREYNIERMKESNTFVIEYCRENKGEIERNHAYGDGIRPGWLYYELKGGNYWDCTALRCDSIYFSCPGRLSATAEPYIPFVLGELSMPSRHCEICEWMYGSEDDTNSKDEEKSTAILGCGCGDDGCDQYYVRITETENSVIWDDWLAFFQNKPNYFHFEFDKKLYYQEVEKLIDLTFQVGSRTGWSGCSRSLDKLPIKKRTLEGLPVEMVNSIVTFNNNEILVDSKSNNYFC